ncbi:putative proteasome subunit beta type 2 [Besnoitia besnoiti]|uniref:Proteasome subunit beta n=1 Tax=Besnoitia besnoiti TaxID=94643 RepID=A0A2A9MB33_BESBE|nr:putative proteasome subunit beta type 2 [Besnoitia besnoiti]PFH32590.1 putative proteasome subunit beta type 2 [Besnoitia besnoiti]
METVIGLRGPTFALVACDRYANSSILRMKDDEDKVLLVDDNKIMGLAGQIGDRLQFGDYIQKNVHLYRFRNNKRLSCAATASFTRQQLAYYLRRSPYHVDVMLAGYDETGPHLYWMDYLASMASVNKGAHGYAAYFLGGLLDRYYHPDLTEEEALKILEMCKKELMTRFIVSQASFRVKIATKDGIRTLDI